MTAAGDTSMQYDEQDFGTLSWHDDSVYGLRLRVGDPEAGDWTSDLVLDLDHIIERGLVQDQRVYLDRRYYAWRIVLNDPPGGLVRFGAACFTLRLLREPLLLDRQHLTPAERGPSGA